MRQIIIAAAMAMGLVALWAAILPLTAQPAPMAAGAGSPVLSRALFLCRGPNGIDSACTAALARALGTGEPRRTSAGHCACRADPATLRAEDGPGD
jgi:hypothetical protein